MLSMKSISHGFAAASAVAFLLCAGPASAETLSTYYKTLMTVKTCELEASEDAMGSLQAAIENKVTEIEASSETINAIFDDLNAAVSGDTTEYCAAESAAALEIINAL
jgi:hypothetical protein